MGGAALYLMAMQRATPPMAQAMLMQQMIRLAGSLHQMHRANNEVAEVERINNTIRTDLATVAAPLPEVPGVGRQEPAHAGAARPVHPLRETTGPSAEHRTHQTTPKEGIER